MTLLTTTRFVRSSGQPGLTLRGAIAVVAAVAALLVGTATPMSAQSSSRLTRVQVLDAPHATAIHLHIDGAPPSIATEVTRDPDQLVLTLEGTINATGESRIEAGGERAATIRIEGAGNGRLRVIVVPGRAVDPFRNYGVNPTDLGVLLTVGVGQLVLRPEASPAPEGPTTPAPLPTPTPVVAVPEPPAPEPEPTPATATAEAERAPESPTEELTPEAPFRDAPDPDIASREPTRADGLLYPVGEVRVEYARTNEGQPDVSELLALSVELLRTPNGYVAARQGVQSEALPIARPASLPPVSLYGSAIRAMNQAIVDEFNQRGLVGVLVLPHEEDIDPNSSRDLRAAGNTTLRLIVWTGQLLEYRTFASGARIPEEDRIDHPAHERVKNGSPVRPGELLNKRELDAYVERLNRHPGRTVDMTLTKSLEPGGVYLDFLVAENRPWNAYVQISDTGTKETSRWRQRAGFVHNQLTGHDDIFRFDYVTGDFDGVHAVFGSYDVPLLGPFEGRVRARLGGSWSDFDASEVGNQDAEFQGDQWTGSAQLLGNVYQYENLFVDLFGGARYQRVENDSTPLPGVQPDEGRANFFFAEAGLRLERRTEESTLELAVSAEANLPSVAGTQVRDLNLSQLGRSFVDDKAIEFLRWRALVSFYLEPLFPSYEDPATPRSSTLAHEIFLQARGQHTSDRLIPYHQAVAGGLNTVRGYTQSLVAADESVHYRAEYRLHLPRLLRIETTPRKLPLVGDFRLAPQQVFGRPDWDLILRAFVDGASLKNNSVQAGEFKNEELMSVGGGVELQLLTNFVGRVDYGYALLSAGDNRVGHDAFHLSFTLVY